MKAKYYFDFFALFFPIIGVVITYVLGVFFSGLKKWIVLFVFPIATLELTFLFVNYANRDGHIGMGGFIPGALAAFLALGLFVYYPVLIVCAVIRYKKNKKTQSTDIPVPLPPVQ